MTPTEAGFYFSLANALLNAGEPPAQAIANLNQAINLDPNFESAHLLLGFIHAKIGQTEKAVKNYEKVLEINPKNSTAQQQLGTLK